MKISTQPRAFEDVVSDLRKAIFSVVRFRPEQAGFRGAALGSGFFVSPDLFLTCHHVINGNKVPHIEGDQYHLVSNHGDHVEAHCIDNGKLGQNIHLFPEFDLALLQCHSPHSAFLALDERPIAQGKEIGVAGYPLPKMHPDQNGAPSYEGLIYRVAKGTVNSTFQTNIITQTGENTGRLEVLEVNFLFVPGNSGGPVFDSRTGRALGFVHGYQAEKVGEKVSEVTMIHDLPDGIGKRYIESLHAIYSLAIQIRSILPLLQRFGVSV